MVAMTPSAGKLTSCEQWVNFAAGKPCRRAMIRPSAQGPRVRVRYSLLPQMGDDGEARCHDQSVVAAVDVDLVVRTGAGACLGVHRDVAATVADVDAHGVQPNDLRWHSGAVLRVDRRS